LLTIARSEGEPPTRRAEHGGLPSPALAAQLALLVASTPLAERGPTNPDDLPAARLALVNATDNALTQITRRAANIGRQALEHLSMLTTAEVAQGFGAGMSQIAVALGAQNRVGRLYDLCRDFLISAYYALTTILGKQILRIAGQHMQGWLQKFSDDQSFVQILACAYDATSVVARVRQLTQTSMAPLDRFRAATLQVRLLHHMYEQQARLIEPFLKRRHIIGSLPAVVFPQRGMFLAGMYSTLGSYAIFAGADCVDAPNLDRLGRAPGVWRIVATALADGEHDE
jgi:hypothetical protein